MDEACAADITDLDEDCDTGYSVRARTAGIGGGSSSRRTHYDVRRSPSPLTPVPRWRDVQDDAKRKIPEVPPLRLPRQPGPEHPPVPIWRDACGPAYRTTSTRHQRGAEQELEQPPSAPLAPGSFDRCQRFCVSEYRYRS